MKALADYVHSKGLKFGLYSDAGEYTCQRRPGSKGYELQDAKQYAAWGVDYLKYDWCHTQGQSAPESYALMRDALKAAGRPIVFSICEWGMSEPWTWAKDVGNLWRTTGDITDAWSNEGGQFGPPPGERGDMPAPPSGEMPAGGPPGGGEAGPPPVSMGLGFIQILDLQADLADYAGPGHWNDPDMLEVGNGGMTVEEYRAHFGLWAILAAPLMAGNDLRNMSPEINEILTNKEVIAVSQDVLGKQGRRVKKDGDSDIWVKELADGGCCIAFLNRGETLLDMTITWSEIGLSAQSMVARDLWQHKDLGTFSNSFSTSVSGHSVVMIRLLSQ
jgi:alpha-galactosidase